MLLGDYIYEVDPDDPVGGYREVREKFKLEDLPINKQQDYADYKRKRINTHKRLALRYAENANKKGIDVSEYYSPTPSCFSSCLLS